MLKTFKIIHSPKQLKVRNVKYSLMMKTKQIKLFVQFHKHFKVTDEKCKIFFNNLYKK